MIKRTFSILAIVAATMFLSLCATASAKDGDYIPDFKFSNIKDHFEKQGFKTSVNAKDIMIWYCSKNTDSDSYNITVMGDSDDKIFSITATYLNYTDKNTNTGAKKFLGYFGSLKYKGAEQVKAREWISKNINNHEATVKYGNINYTIYANPTAPRCRMLRINSPNAEEKCK